MKKLSISLMAATAILFALTTAFTTSSKALTYEVWGIPNLVSGTETTPPTFSALESSSPQMLYQGAFGAEYSDLDDFIANFQDENGQISCNGTDRICVAYVETDQEDVLDVREGVFSQQ